MAGINKVSLGHIENARTETDNAAAHFGVMLKNCESISLNLVGGHGEEGVYQQKLAVFSQEWNRVLGEFLEDERKFVTFLGELRERLQQAHGLYQQNEFRNTEVIGELGKRLDELGG
ncbi:hypothetical protein [Amycolatopsis nigrescens]|uniref:hypothetical protein n=1 Tax=Amycolatopsis nigrescens TaxID=381445 RepID=UPI0003AAE51E|nr:hypothetical protein [Amycolatopsis nigrescens]